MFRIGAERFKNQFGVMGKSLRNSRKKNRLSLFSSTCRESEPGVRNRTGSPARPEAGQLLPNSFHAAQVTPTPPTDVVAHTYNPSTREIRRKQEDLHEFEAKRQKLGWGQSSEVRCLSWQHKDLHLVTSTHVKQTNKKPGAEGRAWNPSAGRQKDP